MFVKTAFIFAFTCVEAVSNVCRRANCIAYNACNRDLPGGGRATGDKREGPKGFDQYAYECCGMSKVMTNECKWPYCVVYFLNCQTTCNNHYGSDSRYEGSYTSEEFGLF